MTPPVPVPEFIEHSGFIAEVIRTQRTKSASIKIDDGVVSVVVPRELPTDRIELLLTNKKRWIKEKLYIHQQAQPASAKEFISGESLPYLGRNYRLKIERGPYQPAKLVKGMLLVTVPMAVDDSNIVRNAVVRWYRTRAIERFRDKSKRYAEVVSSTPKSVGIKTFKSRWGSCSVNGEVLFNWKVVMAPNRIVDYVVVHELCHLLHHDHSKEFWKAVERVMPDYQECKEWLKVNAGGLDI